MQMREASPQYAPGITTEVIEEMARRIVQKAAPRKIVLFGSCARGEIGRDSDVDLLVIEDQPFGPRRSRYREIAGVRRALRGLGVPIDLLIFSIDEMEKWKDTRNHIIATALREGRVLYDRT